MAFGAKDVGPNKRTGLTFKGQEILLCKSRGHPVTGMVKKAMDRGIFPETKKIEAATVYAVTGNVKQAAELSGVPEYQVRSWRKQEWFQAILREVWNENKDKLDVKLTEVIDKAQDLLLDRLNEGDTKILRDGTLVKVPVPAKELAQITGVTFDKRQIIRGEPTSRSESGGGSEKTVSRLEKLAETFENLARHGRKQINVVDAEVIEEKDVTPPTEQTG